MKEQIPKKTKFIKGTKNDICKVLNSIVNEDLIEAILNLAESRFYLKKPMTPLAIKMLIKRLDAIYGREVSDEVKIATINKAISCGWQTVYALSDSELRCIDKSPSYSMKDIFKKVNNFD